MAAADVIYVAHLDLRCQTKSWKPDFGFRNEIRFHFFGRRDSDL